MARSGRLRRPGRGLKSEDQSNPKTSPDTPLAGGRFRLIVDGWATFRPGTCTPPRRELEDAVSPSTIRLKRASTITEIRSVVEQRGRQTPTSRLPTRAAGPGRATHAASAGRRRTGTAQQSPASRENKLRTTRFGRQARRSVAALQQPVHRSILSLLNCTLRME